MIAIPSTLLDDKPAMIAVIARIAKHVLGKADGRRVKTDTTWFESEQAARVTGPAEAVGQGEAALPFRRLERDEVRPFENCVPLYDLKGSAAGRFSDAAADRLPLPSTACLGAA